MSQGYAQSESSALVVQTINNDGVSQNKMVVFSSPWAVDRIGRLIAGAAVLCFALLAVSHHPWWLGAVLIVGANLILTSLIDRCFLRDLLVRFGAKEREELFLPGGAIRPDVREQPRADPVCREKPDEDQSPGSRPPSPRRPTAISRALGSLEEEERDQDSTWAFADSRGNDYRISVAVETETRLRALRLVHQLYRESGYVGEDDGPESLSLDGQYQDTFTLLAEGDRGGEAGTISLVFDSESRLPADDLYGPELDPLREQGRRLAEVTRFAIDKQHSRCRPLLVNLFDFTLIYARRSRHFTDFVIEVNPRHVGFYRRLLNFEVIGDERPCPRVQGAPSVLMRLDLSVVDQKKRLKNSGESDSKDRTLYPRFHHWDEEAKIAQMLARWTRSESRQPVHSSCLARS